MILVRYDLEYLENKEVSYDNNKNMTNVSPIF